ncbi:uncharacterized protein LOC127161868 [Labeo rohita]|uniref:uncharacterized protein LOC127161868 n=1 Tax=Labeo rohita TaxID=84645 RepID=UPI0021E2D5CF|nr:uncharacterized protein LOC127161868 [Labeo rohita]
MTLNTAPCGHDFLFFEPRQAEFYQLAIEMAELDIGAAEDAMFHADLLLAQMKEKQDEKKTSSNRKSKFRWIERDCEGRPLLKRKSRSGETRMRSSATDSEMQKLKEILATTVEASEGPSTSSSWSLRQSAAQDEWQKARPYHLDCLLFSRVVKENKCSQCSSPAIIRCRDCMPEEWLCMEFDVFSTFEEMKTVAPGLSRQGFLRLLEQRTQQFGRKGKIHGDVFQRSFMEYTFCQFLCEKMANVEHFTCPACTPNMLAVSADGNRKLSEEPYFDGIFIAKDADVSSFVEEIRSKVKSTAGKGTCGASQWSAARETARRASKLDEEGLEKELQAATNIHFYCTDISCKYWPYLQKTSVSMPELSPLLQMRPFLSVMHAKAHSTKCEIAWSGRNQEGAGTTAGEEVEMVNSFLSRCALTTKYMTKSARNDMLTVHAIGWNRRKHDGLHLALSNRYVKAVRKAEVESQRLENLSRELRCPENMVQQWVHDVRQWATDDSVDARQGDQHTLQRSIEHMCLGVYQKKASLYNQTDSNKIRQLRRRKLGDEKRKLFEAIKQYNEQVPEEEGINEEMVESRLSVVGHASGEEILIWPWEVHSTESTNILTKKKIFDAYMSKMRLQEEKILILREMRQHCTYLRGLADSIRKLIAEMSGGNRGSLTEEGHCGLCCLLQEKLADVEEKFQVVSSRYSLALGPLYPEDWSKEIPDESKRLEYESSEDSDSEDD